MLKMTSYYKWCCVLYVIIILGNSWKQRWTVGGIGKDSIMSKLSFISVNDRPIHWLLKFVTLAVLMLD